MAELTFEQALEKLENVVKKLENKDISLDEAVKLYNEGLSLSKVCYDLLKKSERLVSTKMSETGESPFDLE
ncbi:MAG: exodeoxyribonuclease VII small subunit [Acholeplasmataceae bacterium]|jgi:exodeoxyribonuclease VII small subunit|nr:exodeoxyribonuclease VII small subunit [Acholeplasmataceae bacterium]MDD4204043.1 exodeoxyribonuclease VII small subunit [Acholeplasmataceae bacterium]MDD4469032.1 exodeoxyribonuclease VII small subunit [Acholeplasmataceae bacterium]MDD4824282.1 exodeoxyribonuclease VII small subunit [Acholeplasmataceae bacterium]MDY0316191.1 exodeoxyribonuclease VII small subunit [Acholeplasmatales bacterium]